MSILMIYIIISDLYIYSLRKIVFVHFTSHISMSQLHIVGAGKCLLNVNNYYEIPAYRSEDISDVNKYEKLLEKTVMKKVRKSE